MKIFSLAVLIFVLMGLGCRQSENYSFNQNLSETQQATSSPSKFSTLPDFISTDYIPASAHDIKVLDLDLDADGVPEKVVVYKIDDVAYGQNGGKTDIEYLRVYHWGDELLWYLIKEDQRAEDAGVGQLGEFCQVEVVNFEAVSPKDFLLVSKCHAWGGNEGYYLFGELPDKPGVFGDLAIPKAYLNEEKYLTEEGDEFLGLESVDVVELGGLIERYGIACELKPNTYDHFGGDEEGYCRRLDILQRFDGHEFTPTIYNGISSTSEVWSLYVNKNAGFQIEYPSDWKINEYFSDNGIFSAVAFDPVSVATLEEYHTLDLALGTVWIFTGEAPTETEMKTVEISPGLFAKTFKIRNEETGPNGWWYNKTDQRYYINNITIAFAYSNDLENDAMFQKQLSDILSSFRIISNS